MKKIIALAIITIFIFSAIPFAFSEERGNNSGSNTSIGSSIKDIREDIRDRREDIKDTINIDRQRCLEKCRNESNQGCEAKCRFNDLKEDMKDLQEDMRERNREGRNKGKTIKVRNAAELNIRHLSSEKIEMLRERFERAKDKFEDARDKLNESRKELKEAMRKGDKNATITHAKDYLLHSSDVFINHLEKLKTKVQENENIPDDKEATIVAQIDAQITNISSIKTEIQAATTKEQAKDAAKKLHDEWSSLQHLIKLFTYRVVAARVEGIVNQGLVLEKRIDKILSKLNESGVHVDISAEVSQFSAKIADSRDKYRQAQAKLTEALDLRAGGEPAESDTIKALVDEAQDLLKQSRDSLKEAHDMLKTILKKIKEASPHTDLSSDSEVEVEHEDHVATHTEGNETEE